MISIQAYLKGIILVCSGFKLTLKNPSTNTNVVVQQVAHIFAIALHSVVGVRTDMPKHVEVHVPIMSVAR